jgi:hypothetical protein
MDVGGEEVRALLNLWTKWDQLNREKLRPASPLATRSSSQRSANIHFLPHSKHCDSIAQNNRLVLFKQIGFLPFVCSFVSVGVRGKPRMYCSLPAYCTARFGRSNFGHQIPPRLPTRSAL